MNLLGKLEDKEVLAPAFIFENNQLPVAATRGTGFGKVFLYFAAAISLILVSGYLTGFQANIQSGDLHIGFAGNEGLDQAEVNQWVTNAMADYESKQEVELTQMKSDLDKRIDSIEKSGMQSLESVLAGYSDNTQGIMKQYVRQVNKENLEMIQNFFLVSSEKQQTYLNTVLADFNKFYQDQREHDLKMIETGLNTMQSRHHVKQQETDLVLANLIDMVKTQNK